jgi:hypothetical protein
LNDLVELTNEMVDHVLDLIRACQDQDVVFIPEDPSANDPYAGTKEEVSMPWTLGHVIVHITASSEESAFLAAELARGIPHRDARSRFEVHWTTIQAISQCRERLEESRRMQLACLNIWPDTPHLENCYESRYGVLVNPIIQHVFGLSHADSHLDQIVDIISQARDHRPS